MPQASLISGFALTFSFQLFSPILKKFGMMKLPQMISNIKMMVNIMFMKLRFLPIIKSLKRITQARRNPDMANDLKEIKALNITIQVKLKEKCMILPFYS